MKPTQKLSADAQFFFDHAGWSHYPYKETSAEGRTRCAINLAAAEAIARNAGVSFEWLRDTDAGENQYGCLLHDAAGKVHHALGGIEFANSGEPWSGDPYRRVIEAELANDYVSEILLQANK